MSLKGSTKHLLSKRGRYLLSRIYPWTGLNGLDRKVLEYIDFEGGIFLSVFYLNRDLKTRIDLNANLTIFIGTVSYGFTAVVARDLSIPALF